MKPVELSELGIDKKLSSRAQRAMVAAKLATLEKHKHKSDTSIDVSQPDAARMLNVGERSVQSARAVINHGRQWPENGVANAARRPAADHRQIIGGA